MTLAIQRQPRFNKVILGIGLIALVAALAVALDRVAESTDAGNPAVVQTQSPIGFGQRFETIHDSYLVPQSVLSRRAAMQAELLLQDGYLPPSAVGGSPRAGFVSIQDGYLPPAGWAPTEPTATPRFDPR